MNPATLERAIAALRRPSPQPIQDEPALGEVVAYPPNIPGLPKVPTK